MEVLNDVLGYDLKIYQNQEWFSFSLDSVLLANFVSLNLNTKKIIDLGTGNGIIPLILSKRTKSNIIGIDIQSDLIEMAQKSVDYNNLSKQIDLKCCDMKDLLKQNINNTYDLVLSNPPYFKNEEKSDKNVDIHKAIARHEIMINLDEIVNIASKLLKCGGNFAMINRTDRMVEIIELFRKNKIEPKLIKFIYKNKDSESTMFFIEGKKEGKSGLKIGSPFIIYNVDGTNSFEYEQLCKEVL